MLQWEPENCFLAVLLTKCRVQPHGHQSPVGLMSNRHVPCLQEMYPESDPVYPDVFGVNSRTTTDNEVIGIPCIRFITLAPPAAPAAREARAADLARARAPPRAGVIGRETSEGTGPATAGAGSARPPGHELSDEGRDPEPIWCPPERASAPLAGAGGRAIPPCGHPPQPPPSPGHARPLATDRTSAAKRPPLRLLSTQGPSGAARPPARTEKHRRGAQGPGPHGRAAAGRGGRLAVCRVVSRADGHPGRPPRRD